MSNRVTHFEIPCNDPQKTVEFFRDVFGWSFQQFGDDQYWLATTGADGTPGINGAIMARRDPRQPVVNTIQVESLDEHMQKVEAAGGKIVVPKSSVPGMGWLCYFTDPDGNIHGLWQLDSEAR